MFLTLATLLLAPAPPSALDLLREARDHYRGLSSFSMRIEHEDSSGLYPGRYTQTLRWRRGGRFELRVIRYLEPGFAPEMINGVLRTLLGE